MVSRYVIAVPIYTSARPLDVPNPEKWLAKHGVHLEKPPSRLPQNRELVLVRYLKDESVYKFIGHTPNNKQCDAWVSLEQKDIDVFSTLEEHWTWYEVPKLLVVPFTDAPLF